MSVKSDVPVQSRAKTLPIAQPLRELSAANLTSLMQLPPVEDRSPPTPPPQFGLRTLFVGVALLCVTLVVARQVAPYLLAVLVLLVLTVGAHLAASGVGSRLTSKADANRRRAAARRLSLPGGGGGDRLRPEAFAPTTRLSQRRPLGAVKVLGPLVGGCLAATCGGWGMARFLAERATVANVGVTTVASGVLGAIFGFLIAAFVQAMVEANVEAWKQDP